MEAPLLTVPIGELAATEQRDADLSGRARNVTPYNERHISFGSHGVAIARLYDSLISPAFQSLRIHDFPSVNSTRLMITFSCAAPGADVAALTVAGPRELKASRSFSLSGLRVMPQRNCRRVTFPGLA